MANSLGRTSLILAAGTLVSRILGFVKAIVLAGTIGLVGSASADAFANANSLPTNVYALISGGLLGAVLVPQIIRAMDHDDGGKDYINRLLTLAMTLLAALAVVLTLAAPVLAWVYGMTLNEQQLGLVIAFAYWCVPQVFFYGLYAVLSEVLNARSVFAPFAWAPALNNLFAIAVLTVFAAIFGADATGARAISDWSGGMVMLLGGGTTLGVVAQATVLFAFLRHAGVRYRPDFRFRGTGLGRIGRLAGWSFGVLVIVQIAGWVETLGANIAFGAAASLAALQNAWMIFMLPHSIITVSLTTTMFTRLSKQAAAGDAKSVVEDFGRGTRVIALFMVFCTVGMMVISPAFARVFTASDASVVAQAWVLCAALIGLAGYSLLYYTQRVFYAFEDTRSVFVLYAWTAPIHVALILLLAHVLPVQFIVVALVSVQTFITTLRFVVQYAVLRQRLGRVDGARLLRALTRFALLSVPTAVVGAAVVWLFGGYTTGGFARSGIAAALTTCALAGLLMAVVFFGGALFLRVDEVAEFAAQLRRRFDGVRGRHSVELHRHASIAAGADEFAEQYGSLINEYEAEAMSVIGSVTPSPQTVLAQHTARLPSRRELREYEARMRREAYEKRRSRDEEPLL